MLACARHRRRFTCEHAACGTDRIERVVLAAQPPLAAELTADSERRLVLYGEKACQSGAVVAGAFDRPHAGA
jgi:hypothetical protein